LRNAILFLSFSLSFSPCLSFLSLFSLDPMRAYALAGGGFFEKRPTRWKQKYLPGRMISRITLRGYRSLALNASTADVAAAN